MAASLRSTTHTLQRLAFEKLSRGSSAKVLQAHEYLSAATRKTYTTRSQYNHTSNNAAAVKGLKALGAAALATPVNGRFASTVAVSSPTSSLAVVPTYACEKSAVQNVYQHHAAPHRERAFFVNDIGVVERQHTRWVEELPRVRPFFAIKCNPDEMLLRVLAGKGTGFDCASGEEMAACLKIGVKPEDIIFANPIKNIQDLKFAARHGVKKMTFDNVAELEKIKKYCPQADLVLRLLPDDSGSVMRFGVKFGCPAIQVEPVLQRAKELDLNVVGVSFHIGSGCFDPLKYDDAIKMSRAVFDLASQKLGMEPFTVLDLGGGFPGAPTGCENADGSPAFESFSAVIRRSLDQNFPAEQNSHVNIIAEPGRYMATAWSTLFTLVQGKRECPTDPLEPEEHKYLYYINDGVYGSFNCLMFDHAKATPIPAYRFWDNKMALEVPKARVAKKVAQAAAHYPQLNIQQHSMFTAFLQAAAQADTKQRHAGARGVHTTAAVHSAVEVSSRPINTKATLFGPTCDSMDCVATDYPLEELHVGEWLAFEHYGAYTVAAASTFNGMQKPTINYVRSLQPSPLVA